MMAHFPRSFGQWLQVQAYARSKPREIVIVSNLETLDRQALPSVVRDGHQLDGQECSRRVGPWGIGETGKWVIGQQLST
jgi:hypothetical protein